MRRPVRWGITLPLPGQSLAELPKAVEELEDLGYTDGWTQEVAGADAFTPLALAAPATRKMRLGTAIAGVMQRGPALLAMSAAAIADAAPGRFVLGIGTSSSAIVEGWNGMSFERPLARVRDTLRFLRRALAGERIDEDFETFRCRGFRLERPPEYVPPIHLAALRRRMLELAVREADGVILSFVGAEEVEALRSQISEAPEELALRIPVILGEDRERAHRIARRTIANYFSVPVYEAFRRELDGAAGLDAMWDAWRTGDRDAARRAVPQALVDSLYVCGGVEECRDKLKRFVASGITTPILAIHALDCDPLEAARALAPR